MKRIYSKPVAKDPSQRSLVEKLASLKEKMSVRDIEIAGSLVMGYNRYGRLTDKQINLVNAIITRIENPVKLPDTVRIDAQKIFSMMTAALATVKRVKVELRTSTGQRLVCKIAGPTSKYAGQIMISDGGPFGAAMFFGRIQENGEFLPTQKATQPVIDLIKEFSADPEVVAANYGRLTGSCCFCKKTLDDDRSKAVGYGPICAKRFNLPWK